MKKIIAFILLMMLAIDTRPQPSDSDSVKPLVQLCLIIDVSGSMNNLLLQAQTQIWSLLDYVGEFELKKQHPDVEIAVITVGDFVEDGKQVQNKLVSDFTRDFAQLADLMFELQTGGGNEFFGQAIDRAVNELNWQESSVFKTIMVAGNESFAQGPTSYKKACASALKNGVLVNTIFYGNYDPTKNLLWDSAAEIGGGAFTFIEQDQDSLNHETPFDHNVIEQYRKFMETFNFKNKPRIPAKGLITPAYRNMIINRMRGFKAPRDIIEIFEESDWDFDAIQPNDIPEELKGLGKREFRQFLVKRAQQRSNAREGLYLYQKKIEGFLNIKLGVKKEGRTLDEAAQEIITGQLTARGFIYRKD